MQRIPVLILLLWASAFGVLEGTLVLELRAAFDPAGTSFPALALPPRVLRLEQAREVASLALLGATAALATRSAVMRFAAFLVLFGTWDLAYYASLRALSGWPPGLDTWDLLFLVPVPWYAPVYAPIVVAFVMTACGLAALRWGEATGRFHVGAGASALATLGGAIVLASFLRPQGFERPYPWPLLLVGLAVGLVGFRIAWLRNASRGTSNP